MEAVDEAIQESSNQPRWLRLAYSAEFLAALPALMYVWAQVGGQGHIELLPWYLKLGSLLLLAWCWVRFTAALVEQPRVWNRTSIGWLVRIVLMMAWMGSVIYYYHLHEVSEDPDAEETAVTSLSKAPSKACPSQTGAPA